jgi:hypothetical protein
MAIEHARIQPKKGQPAEVSPATDRDWPKLEEVGLDVHGGLVFVRAGHTVEHHGLNMHSRPSRPVEACVIGA